MTSHTGDSGETLERVRGFDCGDSVWLLKNPVMEYTLALIKPDAVKAGKAGEMQQLMQLSGFNIITKRQLQLTHHMAEEFYAEHKSKLFYPGLVEFMTSGPIVALVLAKSDAIKSWRELMGPTDVFEARVRASKSMRALYGTDGTRNAAHGSDSPASAAREIKFYFPDLKLAADEPAADARAYIEQKLNPTLLKALTALAKEKPTSQEAPQEAVIFLANWLLEHNPFKPRIAVPEDLLQQQRRQMQEAQAAVEAAARVDKLQQAVQHSASNGAGQLQVAPAENGVAIDDSDAQNAAATKVQACFRGHIARKHVAEMRVVLEAGAA